MTQRLTSNETFHGKVMPRIPMRRWGRGEDFGGIAVYLMSSAARYHTGDTFRDRWWVFAVLSGAGGACL